MATADLPPTPSQDEMLFALSKIVHRREYCPPSPPVSPSSSCQKYLKLVGLLSLLLVTQAKGDVAAVMLLQKDHIELLYSKNRPCNDTEKDYIEGLFLTASNTLLHTNEKLMVLVLSIVRMCKQKMNSRLQKVCRRLGDLEKQRFAISHTSLGEVAESEIRARLSEGIFPPDASLASFLEQWFDFLLCNKMDLISEWTVYQPLQIAYYVGNASGMELILDSNLLGRIRKFGDYFAAALALINAVIGLSPIELQNLVIKEVVADQPIKLSLP